MSETAAPANQLNEIARQFSMGRQKKASIGTCMRGKLVEWVIGAVRFGTAVARGGSGGGTGLRQRTSGLRQRSSGTSNTTKMHMFDTSCIVFHPITAFCTVSMIETLYVTHFRKKNPSKKILTQSNLDKTTRFTHFGLIFLA